MSQHNIGYRGISRDIYAYCTSLRVRALVEEDGSVSFVITRRELAAAHQQFIDPSIWVNPGRGRDPVTPRDLDVDEL